MSAPAVVVLPVARPMLRVRCVCGLERGVDGDDVDRPLECACGAVLRVRVVASVELSALRCPHCGGEPEHGWHGDGPEPFDVACCALRTRGETLEAAAAAWRVRVAEVDAVECIAPWLTART